MFLQNKYQAYEVKRALVKKFKFVDNPHKKFTSTRIGIIIPHTTMTGATYRHATSSCKSPMRVELGSWA